MNLRLILNKGCITNNMSQLLKADYFDYLALSASLHSFTVHRLTFKTELRVDSLGFYFIFLLLSIPLRICHVGTFFGLHFITFYMRNRKQVRARGKWHGSEHLQRQSGNSLGKDALLRIWIVGTARAFTMASILLLCFGISLAGTSEPYKNVIPKYFTHINVFYPAISLVK